jgi:hypothetical protein
MTDKELRLECLKIVAEMNVPAHEAVNLAERFFAFTDAKDDRPKRPPRIPRKY